MCGRISSFLAADLRCHVSQTKNEMFRLMKICGLWSFNPRPKPFLGGVCFFSNDVLGEGFVIPMGLSLLARATRVPPGGGGFRITLEGIQRKKIRNYPRSTELFRLWMNGCRADANQQRERK